MPSRLQGASRAALSLAVFAAFAAPMLATPALAQTRDPMRSGNVVPAPVTPIAASETRFPAWSLQLLNPQRSPNRAMLQGQLRADGDIEIDYSPAEGDEVVGPAQLSDDRMSVSGRLPAIRAAGRARNVRIHQDWASGTLVLDELDDAGQLIRSVDFTPDTRDADVTRNTYATAERFGAWLGDWSSGQDVLTVQAQGKLLTGVVTDAGIRAVKARIVFLNAPDAPKALYGLWEAPGAGGYLGGTLEVALDGPSAFAGRRYDNRGRGTGWAGTRTRQQPAPAPTPPPAPVPPPAPAPAPPPPAPDTAQAGVFHRLEGFDVRLDEARAGRDGRAHVFLTVRNKSGRDYYMSAGPFQVLATDADGVGVQAESRPYRATGEEAVAFDPIPTIPAGGEFRMRYAIALPDVHGPLARLSLRESAKKALRFDIAHADPGASPAAAPPAGRGGFKALSKFDVRIDNVVPARDGKLEVFLTLRNASRDVQSTSKGAIRLEATDADGGTATSVSALYSIRGERGRYDELPLLVYAEPGAEMRLRYVFDQAISGPITVSDGTVRQVFTPGG